MAHSRPAAALLAAAALALPPASAHAATLVVGPGQAYTTVASAVRVAQDGDTVEVMAGVYVNDFPDNHHKITLRAVGGEVTLRAVGHIPNEKGIFVTYDDLTITGFRFINATVTLSAGGNGAGIRDTGGNLVIDHCYFAFNQNGLLVDPAPAVTVTITNSEFYANGVTSGPLVGFTHNLYIGQIASLDFENNYTHAANYGHELKSLAATTIVRNSRIVDGPTGTSSYSIDLPNGGAATIEGNQIEQGPNGQNGVIIAYGEEGNILPGSTLSVTGNLIENDMTRYVPVLLWNAAGAPATISGNRFHGMLAPYLLRGSATLSGNTYLHREPLISILHTWAVGSF